MADRTDMPVVCDDVGAAALVKYGENDELPGPLSVAAIEFEVVLSNAIRDREWPEILDFRARTHEQRRHLLDTMPAAATRDHLAYVQDHIERYTDEVTGEFGACSTFRLLRWLDRYADPLANALVGGLAGLEFVDVLLFANGVAPTASTAMRSARRRRRLRRDGASYTMTVSDYLVDSTPWGQRLTLWTR